MKRFAFVAAPVVAALILPAVAGSQDAPLREIVTVAADKPMAMKAAVDHGVDLRNHDASRSWSDGYADN